MSLELGGGNRDRFKYDFNYCIYYTEYCNYSDYLNAGGNLQVLARSPEQQILTGAKIRDVPWKECL